MVVIAVSILVLVMIMTMIVVMSVVPMIVAWVIFGRSNEIDGSITGMVLVAVPAPVLGMSRRNMQVHRRKRRGLRLNQHGLRINERRRPLAAQLNLTVNARRDLTR